MFLIHHPHLFPLLLSIYVLATSINSQPNFFAHNCSSSSNNNTSNSTNFSTDLSNLLSNLSSKATVNSFYSLSSNQVYSLYLCRGDVSSGTCNTCVKNATQNIRQRCGSNKTAIIWYDECMLRYSDL